MESAVSLELAGSAATQDIAEFLVSQDTAVSAVPVAYLDLADIVVLVGSAASADIQDIRDRA